MSGGRGGQPPKLVLRTEGGWTGKREIPDLHPLADREVVEAAVGEISDQTWEMALHFLSDYERQMAVFENPPASKDKNGQGVGRFGKDMQRSAAKMAAQLDQALGDERSHDLDGLIEGFDLRSYMTAAYENLTAIEELIDRAQEGEAPPLSPAEIRRNTGMRLKALAGRYNLPQTDFVRAFGIHNANSDEAFGKWFQRLTVEK